MTKTVQIVVFAVCCAAVESVAGSQCEIISDELAKIIEGTEVPSLAAAAVLDGSIVAAGASGVRKRGESVPVTLSDKYHIGSCTKSMTATLAAILVAEQVITWQTTVGDVFSDLDVHEGYRTVTLHQLLSHTAGYPREVPPVLWARLWAAQGTPRAQRLQLAKGILRKPPQFAPGRGFEYSNAGVSVAGAMLERLTDTPYETLMHTKLFQPLGMHSAGFRAPATNGQVDHPYGHDPRPVDPEPRGDNPRAIAPGGAVHCSILDFASYARFHLGRGSAKILDPSVLEFLHTPVDRQEGYALGWRVTRRSWAAGDALTHTGCNKMFYAVIWLAPQRDFAAVAACNLGTQEGFRKCDAAIAMLVDRYLAQSTDKATYNDR